MTVAVAMTYDSLVENIQSYLERTDTATLEKIPLFIMLAEQVIASEIKFLGNLNVANSTFTTAQNTLQKPARWHKTVSMNVTVAGERQPILLRTYEYLREYWPDDTQTGIPKFYCDYNYDNWLVAPTPASNYSFEAMPFLKNDERTPMWQAQYQAIMNTLKTENTQRIGDRQATVLDT